MLLAGVACSAALAPAMGCATAAIWDDYRPMILESAHPAGEARAWVGTGRARVSSAAVRIRVHTTGNGAHWAIFDADDRTVRMALTDLGANGWQRVERVTAGWREGTGYVVAFEDPRTGQTREFLLPLAMYRADWSGVTWRCVATPFAFAADCGLGILATPLAIFVVLFVGGPCTAPAIPVFQ